MKYRLYCLLVNRHPEIEQCYIKFRNGSSGIRKYISWLYLLALNFCYYVLFFRWLGEKAGTAIYEEKKLEICRSESELPLKCGITVDSYVERLLKYDVISFDIFDTLIFRPFSEPTDLFYFVGEGFDVLNFKEIRTQMEKKAREKCHKEKGYYEVTLKEIWQQMKQETGIPSEAGMQTELDAERKFCYANPFMREVYRKLLKAGKKIIIVSDMYLPSKYLSEILKENGYTGYSKLYVSCEHGKSKAEGSLFALVRREQIGEIVHVGDNAHSDGKMARKNALASLIYPNVDSQSQKYRPYDMSPIVGGAYRGVVNHRLYNGLCTYSMNYEYGFVYGGLFVTGYCAFIHDYCRKNQIGKILFLSRDGDILKQAYEIMFPEEKTEYVYWSRRVAAKLMAGENRQDYFRRFLFHKVNQKIRLETILKSMELESLVTELPKTLSKSMLLTDKNVAEVKAFVEQNWAKVLAAYEEEQKAAKAYFTQILQDCTKAVAVDIGWAGSGAISLNHLAQKVWGIPCEIIGILAGTNTIYNAEPNASEMFLQSGKLVSYLYSQRHNRELMKKHNPNRNYNVYWELLLSSPTPQLKGFGYDEKNGWKLIFGDYDANREGITEIQRGILQFVQDYKEHFGDMDYMYKISGRDAYAPMLLAAGKNEKYLRKIESGFSMKINIS